MSGRVAALVALGLLQVLADALSLPTLKRIARATVASPAPETFPAGVFIEWDAIGQRHSVRVTPERLARWRGPDRRRTIYRAALAEGAADDLQTAALVYAAMRHALCHDAPLLRGLGIDPGPAAHVRIRYEPDAASAAVAPRVLEPRCR